MTDPSSFSPALERDVRRALATAGDSRRARTKIVPVVTDTGGSPFSGAASIAGDAGGLARTRAVLFVQDSPRSRYIPVTDIDVARARRVGGVEIDALLTNVAHVRRASIPERPSRELARAAANESRILGDGGAAADTLRATGARVESIAPSGAWTVDIVEGASS